MSVVTLDMSLSRGRLCYTDYRYDNSIRKLNVL